MRCTVVYYVCCWNFLLSESLSTETSEVRRIIGGRDADETKYQYVVRLQAAIIYSESSKDKKVLFTAHRCTAAVLTPTWTLTAAHCSDTKDIEVLIDSEKTSILHFIGYGSLKTFATRKVMDIINHPAYRLKLFMLYNDVALVRHQPITLDQYARLSGLDYKTMIGQEVTLVGYGITNGTITLNTTVQQVADDATTLKKPLQLVEALIVQCSADNHDEMFYPRMCLARRCNKLSGICTGDSGGPVIHESGVVGINSVGSKEMPKFCNLEPYKIFYDLAGITPTSLFIDWISRVMRNEVPKYDNRK